MSIFKGLTKDLQVFSSYSNQINSILDTAKKIEKISSIYRISDKYYSFGMDKDLSAKYPFQNEQKDILLKPNYVYSLVCKDAVTKEIIDPINLDFEILNINGNYNYNIEKTNTSFDVEFTNLPIHKVIKITVKIKGNNYLQTYSQIISGSSASKHTQEIQLVALNNIPDGVGVNELTVSQDSNGTTQNQTLVVPSSASKYESSSFEIPAGTKFYDKDGNRLSGDITFTVGHFSPTNPTSRSLFHSGWNISSIILDGRELTDNEKVTFVTAGFFSIIASDSTGKEGVTIQGPSDNPTSPIKCKTSINPNLINSETNLPFVVGETMPYWRLNPEGLWEEHSMAVVKDDGGTLVFEFDMVSFSRSNLDRLVRCGSSSVAEITLSPFGTTITRRNW